MKIFVYAFANTAFFFHEVIKESKKLKYNIEWGIVYPRNNWKDISDELIESINKLCLYENFNDVYNNIDIKNFDYIEGMDNIYKILESSKFSYKTLDSKEQLQSAYTIYKIYKDFLIKNKPDYFIFPDLEVVDGLILFNICKELNIETMYCVHTRNMGKSFFAQDYYETLPNYYGEYEKQDYLLASNLVDKFEIGNVSDKNILVNNSDSIDIKVPNFVSRYFKSLYIKYKYESKHIDESNFILRIKMNLPNLTQKCRNFIFNSYQINFFHISKEKDWIPKNYIIFPLQVTPESSINTLEQYFIKQDRVIDLIRLNMPTGFYLLLKEHPAMIGKRSSSFYKKIRKKAGCLLVSPYLNTEKFIRYSKLVITVTGTVGLESYFKDKPVLMFGPTFFSNLVDQFQSYRYIKDKLIELINKNNFDTKDKKIEQIAKIYNITYPFIVHEPFHFKKVMTKENIENFLDAILDHIKRIKRYQSNV